MTDEHDPHEEFLIGDLVTCLRIHDIFQRPLVCRIIDEHEGLYLLDPLEPRLALRRAVPASQLTLVERPS